MFKEHFTENIFEVSHKKVKNPTKENYANHMHTYCEIVLFVSGDVNYNIDGNFYKPQKYDLMFIPKDTYHYLSPYCETVYENYVLSFKADMVSKEQYEKIFTFPYIVNISDDIFALNFFSRLDHYNKILSLEDFKAVSYNLTKELLVYCSYLDKTTYEHEISNNPIVDSIIQYITENLKKPINSQIIAQNLNLSKSYVQNVFSEKMDIGLKQYILRKKLFAARNEINEGKKALTVCNEYGFDDYSCFYRAYKKVFGVSPKTKN